MAWEFPTEAKPGVDSFLILPDFQTLGLQTEKKKPLTLKALFSDPGLAQGILSFHWSQPGPKLPVWHEFKTNLTSRLAQSRHFFQVNFSLAKAQDFWQSQNRLAGILEILSRRLTKKTPISVFHHLAFTTIRGFFPYLRWISPFSETSPPKAELNIRRFLPWKIQESQLVDPFWSRVLELGQLLAGDWEKESSYISIFETAWPLIRELNVRAPAKVLDELIEERDQIVSTPVPIKIWKPVELRCTIEGIHLGAQQIQKKQTPTRPKMDINLVKSLVREELAEMAAGAGHEINNPLGILTGTIQKLHKDILKIGGESELNSLVQSLDLMKRQVQRVRSQIEDLMAFARPPVPRTSLVAAQEAMELWEKETVSQGFVLDQSKTTRPESRPNSPKLKGKPAGQIDKDLFTRVGKWILEFASSQLSMDRPKSVRLCQKTSQDDLIFEMEYHQPPPKPSQILHLFTPFFCPKGFGRSSGLQLAASRSILEKMEGSITLFASAEADWTTIQVRIPRTKKETGNQKHQSNSREAA